MVKSNHSSGVSTLKNRHYDAASKDGSGAGWNAKDITPESETLQNEEIEKRARDLYRNSPIARTIVESHEQQVMHGGVALLMQGQSKRLDDIKSLVMQTLDSSQLDTNRLSSFNELLALVIRETSITGNCFALRVIDKTAPLGFRIKLLEYSYLDRKLNGKEGRNRIVRGTELDARDTPVAYWLKPSIEPGDTRKSRRYPIEEIAHTFVPTRVGSLGGICWYAPAMMHIRMLEDILISAQQRQATAQSFTAFIRLPPGYQEESAGRNITKPGTKKSEEKAIETDDRGFAKSTRTDEKLKRKIKNDEYVRGLSEIRPNTFYILRPGEEIELATPPAPIDLASIIKPIVMFISKCTGLSYETILGDFSNGSYSATRMSNIQPVLWTKSRREMITNRFLQKVWAWIVDGLDTKGYDMTGIEHKWQFPEIVSAHPKEDLEMTWDRIHHNAGTVSEYIRSTNRDPEMVFKERAEEIRKMKELGLDATNIGEPAGDFGKRSAAKSNSNRTAQEGTGSAAGREQLQ
jgi:lambda family phage portal protein